MIESLAENLRDQFALLPNYLGGHMLISLAALTVGLGISLPLGILATRRPRLAEWALGAASVVQTVPSLALLALMVPLLGGRIGFLPAFLALTLYSLLPILANTVIGIQGVDADLIEAARGVGMTDTQMLVRVQLPLAAPVIIAGIRTATVLVVGTATLVTPVGGQSLGNYIFGGLEMNNQVATVFGCVLAALLAVVLDQLVRLLELAARRRSRRLAWVAAVGLCLVLGGGLYPPILKLFRPPAAVVASAPFTEQHILSEVLAEKLRAAGFTVDQRPGMGETIQFLALRGNQVDCCVNYSGNVWATLMKRQDTAAPQTVFAEAAQFLESQYGVVCLGRLGFENAYALAMRRDRAARLGIRTVADLKTHAPRMKVGGDLQIFSRPEWARVCDNYGLSFEQTVPMDPTLMYDAAASGAVDVICAYTSDGRLEAHDLVLLRDPMHAFPPYDAMLLVSGKAAQTPGFTEALLPLVEAIPIEKMREANYRVDVDGQRPRQAATELLERIQTTKARLP